MNSSTGGIFDEFEAIQKKMIEHFQDGEHNETVDLVFDRINFFHNKNFEIEDYEKSINSHARPIRLGFVGGFSTGKSSMINSLLGEDILGVKLEPATSQITELTYGEKFEVLEVTVEKEYFNYKEISLEAYQKSSTTRVDKLQNLSHYIIKHPSKNLSQFTIIDTPGFSSTSKEDDELTKKWIETLDLLIWIFDANKVGDKTEYNKLKELGSSIKVIGVINKIDTKSPGVREKIRNEILNEELLEDVFFYSSKKVLDEFTNHKSFDEILQSISSEIKNCVNNSETFVFTNSDSGVILKTSSITKPFDLVPLKKTSYTSYYDSLVSKIDNVRNNEINLILNQTLVKKYNEFINLIKVELNTYHELFTEDISDYSKLLIEKNELLQISESIYDTLTDDFKAKIEASFKVFYTSFFNELGDHLLYKHIDKGVFSDDVYIDMIDIDDEEGKGIFYEFISEKFQSFLKDSFDIYEKSINNSIYKEFSDIEETRNNKYHIINTIVEGLVNCSINSIVGYQRNFNRYKTESFLQDLQFHKQSLELVIPDELLKNSISKLLIADLIDASVDYESSLENEIGNLESQKNNTLEIVNMIAELLKKLD